MTTLALHPSPARSAVTPQEAALEILRRRRARRHLIDFAEYVDPTYRRSPHLELFASYLERVHTGEITRLMLLAPPRHGKSKLVSEIFPAWELGHDPSHQFMQASHSASLAETFSRNVRNLIGSSRYRILFPQTELSDDSATIQKWTLAGFTRPAMLTIGVGGSPVGQGTTRLNIDDPIGDASEADSALQRENLYRWYTDTIYTRLEPNAAIILMMQRWHEDDLAGRLLRDQVQADKWVVLYLPALADEKADREATNQSYFLPASAPDALGRKPGEALWPERFPSKTLQAIRAVNPRSFQAKYQQRPRPAQGAIFKRNWFRIENAAPHGLSWARYYDLAYSLKRSGHRTATIGGALDRDGVLYLRRGHAGKLESPDARRLIRELMLAEPEARHGVEKAVHGEPAVQELMRETELARISLRATDVHSDKMVRAVPVADRMEVGKVVFVRESINDDVWIADWIEEMVSFPYGEFDDRVDAVSGVLSILSGGSGWADWAKKRMEKMQQESEAQHA